MSIENSANAAVIIINGNIIDGCIEDFENMLIEAGWCNVFHQSTENLIIGILITPHIVIKVVIFKT